MSQNSNTKTVTRKQLISNLMDYFEGDLVKFDITGCASLFGFRDDLPTYMQLIKVDDNQDNAVSEITQTIVSECKALPQSSDYN